MDGTYKTHRGDKKFKQNFSPTNSREHSQDLGVYGKLIKSKGKVAPVLN
jgi:hypothetical protein